MKKSEAIRKIHQRNENGNTIPKSMGCRKAVLREDL